MSSTPAFESNPVVTDHKVREDMNTSNRPGLFNGVYSYREAARLVGVVSHEARGEPHVTDRIAALVRRAVGG